MTEEEEALTVVNWDCFFHLTFLHVHTHGHIQIQGQKEDKKA